MGHHITAIVTANQISTPNAEKYDLPFVVERGFTIIFLDFAHADFWENKLGIQDEGGEEIILDCASTHFFAKELGIQRFALIHTDYFAGIGEQYACVYENGTQIMPTTLGGIDEALKTIGVIADGKLDEFDTLNLSEYRSYDGIIYKLMDKEKQNYYFQKYQL